MTRHIFVSQPLQGETYIVTPFLGDSPLGIQPWLLAVFKTLFAKLQRTAAGMGSGVFFGVAERSLADGVKFPPLSLEGVLSSGLGCSGV